MFVASGLEQVAVRAAPHFALNTHPAGQHGVGGDVHRAAGRAVVVVVVSRRQEILEDLAPGRRVRLLRSREGLEEPVALVALAAGDLLSRVAQDPLDLLVRAEVPAVGAVTPLVPCPGQVVVPTDVLDDDCAGVDHANSAPELRDGTPVVDADSPRRATAGLAPVARGNDIRNSTANMSMLHEHLQEKRLGEAHESCAHTLSPCILCWQIIYPIYGRTFLQFVSTVQRNI